MRAFHDSRSGDYRAPFGALPLGNSVKLTLDVWDEPDATVTLRTWIDGRGEARYPMKRRKPKSADEPTRFSASLKPDAAGIVWYQFIIATPDEREVRYGAQDGKLGGVGRLADWEPPSFKLAVFDPASERNGSLGETAGREYARALVAYLRGESRAGSFVEGFETLRESYPESAFRHATDILSMPERAHLMACLAGATSVDEEPRAALGDYQLGPDLIGRAKGRLWCAALIQALAPREANLQPTTKPKRGESALDRTVADWSTVDADCGTIVQNAFDLRSSIAPLGQGDSTLAAINDDVLAIWRRLTNGTSACVLVNASLQNARDIAIPLESASVSEIISGYGVHIATAAEVGSGIPQGMPIADRYACVHLHQLGSAILYFHGEERLEKPMEPGLGVLAHITSLPANEAQGATSKTGTAAQLGTLGPQAYAFVDWLAAAGVRYWQVLPVNPTDEFGSPYAGISAFAGNTLLLEGGSSIASLGDAAAQDARGYKAFCKREAAWLEPYASFMAIRRKVGARKRWQSWPKQYRTYDPALITADDELAASAEQYRQAQFAFETHWKSLRAYANERGVKIIGDMPIYVSADSADVWAHPEVFQLGANGKPKSVAGCPPDAFAVEGQIWGSPLYDWDAIAASGYDWWMRRLKRAFDLYDIVRLDHFIGFARYYSIPAGKKATEGTYRPGPGIALFEAARKKFGPLPIIAEDLGLITPAVRGLGAACGFPGMDVVQFVDGNDPLAGYQPRPEKIAYTGTHDNHTLVGYVQERYPDLNAHDAADRIMRSVVASNAPVAIVPLQDVLGLDDGARMNVPGVAEGNWTWQAEAAAIEQASDRLRDLVALVK